MLLGQCEKCGTPIVDRDIEAGRGVKLEDKLLCAKCLPSDSASMTTLPTVGVHTPAGSTAFYFCEKCGKRVTDAELAAGKGRDKQVKGVHCAACSDGTMTVSFDAITKDDFVKEDRKRGQSERRSSSTRLTASKGPRRPHRSSKANRSNAGTVMVVVLVAVVCAVAGFFMIGRSAPNSDRPSTSKAKAEASAVHPAPSSSPKTELSSAANPAARQLAEIRAMITADLRDYVKVRQELDQFAKSFADTPEAQDAKALQAEVEEKYTQLAEESLAEVLAAAKEAASKGEFGEAESKVRSIEPRFGQGIWFESKGKAAVEEALADLAKRREAWELKNVADTLEKARAQLAAGRLDEPSKLIANRTKWPDASRTQADALAAEIERKVAEAAAAKKLAEEADALLAEFDRLMIAGEYARARDYAKSKGSAGGAYSKMLRGGGLLAGKMAGEPAAVIKGARGRVGQKVQLKLIGRTEKGTLKEVNDAGMIVATTFRINDEERERNVDLVWENLHAEQRQEFARLGGLGMSPGDAAVALIYKALASNDLTAAREALDAAGDHPLGARLAKVVRERQAQLAYESAMELAEKKRWKAAKKECEKALELRPQNKRAAELLAEVRRHIEPAPTLTLDLGGGVKMEFVYIRPGKFTMGGESDPKYSWQGVEKPKHEVAITKGFYLGKYEVTQAQYEAVMRANPSKWKEANRPVEQVSWVDATEFCRKASEKTRRAVRLPTEAEWEFACRAGTTTDWSHGSDAGKLGEYAWFRANSGKRTHPVGRKKPNAWGLYDMHGNVWEWVADWYGADYYASSPREDPTGPTSGTCRLQRGGCWFIGNYRCRSAFRDSRHPKYRDLSRGFRTAVSSPVLRNVKYSEHGRDSDQ